MLLLILLALSHQLMCMTLTKLRFDNCVFFASPWQPQAKVREETLFLLRELFPGLPILQERLSPGYCYALYLCYLYDDCLIGPLTDLDMQILHVTSPVGCLGAVVPIRSQICQSLCGLWIKIEVYLYLTGHIDEIVQVWRLASKIGRSGQEKFPGCEHRG